MNRRWVVLLVLVALVVAAVVDIAYDLRRIRRIHEANMLKAEALKGEFEQHVRVGATAADVDRYLTDSPPPPSVVRESRLNATFFEVAHEQSIAFGCGRESVGVVFQFDNEARLIAIRTTSWSWDCL